MSNKQKLQEILAKLKSWSESSGDETLDEHIKELETEINASYDPQGDSEEGDTGGNSPSHKPGTP
jgi:hypothetical protein